MASNDPKFTDKTFLNWLKSALAVFFTKTALDKFVLDELTQFQKDLLESIFSQNAISAGTVCTLCTTENVLYCPTQNFCPRGRRCDMHDPSLPDKLPGKLCPSKICQFIRDGIRTEHRYKGPSWKACDARKWCTDAFEIGKCYLPPDGYSKVVAIADMDFNGTLSIIINNKRFQKKLTAQLNLPDNVCIKARDVGRKVRHSAGLAISDTELAQYIDTLIDLLSDPKCLGVDQKAREAVDKLRQLKANTLTVTTEDITSVLENTIQETLTRQREDALQAISVEKDEAQREIDGTTNTALQHLDAAKNALNDLQMVKTSSLDQIIATKLAALDEIKKLSQKEMQGIALESAKEKQLLKEEIGKERVSITEKTSKEELEKYMKDDLISFYLQQHSTIPVSPLLEEHDVPLTECYVQSPLTAIDITRRFGQFEETKRTTSIHSYRDLFYHSGGNVYKNIYVTAKAGVGKTSFAKKLCMTWCQAHSPVKSLHKKFEPENIEVMKTFDLLFMVSLRDIDNRSCDLDDMIFNGVITALARRSKYSKDVLEDILTERTCLVILDGLDEWSHPEDCQRGCYDENKLPHIPARDRSSIMITTRPWKLDIVKLGTSQIDRHIEINELDDPLSEELIANAVTALNNRTLPSQTKITMEFKTATSTIKLDTMRYIPYILLQMIGLWFDGKPVGESKCEMYSNIIGLMLSRGLTKAHEKGSSPPKRPDISNSDTIPPCLLSNYHCKAHYDVLLGLAEVAFKTIFSFKMESSLVIDKSVVLQIIPENTLAFCLEVGLLSQNRHYGAVTSRRSNVSFPHKSIQEYFAALYIHTYPDNQAILKQILQVCVKLTSVLHMSNVFTFLGGFSPLTCEKILRMLHDIVENDDITRQFRRSTRWKTIYTSGNSEIGTVKESFQSMQTAIVQETKDNGHKECPFSIEDIILNRHTDRLSLKSLSENSKDRMKSLSIESFESAEVCTDTLNTLGLKNVQNLQKLDIEAFLGNDDFDRLLSSSVQTLTCLHLKKHFLHLAKYITLYRNTIEIIVNMHQLQSLSLGNICFAHSDISYLLECISNKVTIREITLRTVKCKGHDDMCTGCCLDLSRHQTLTLLKLVEIPLSGLNVHSSLLETCVFGDIPRAVHSAAVRCLHDATNLQELSLRDTTWQHHTQEILQKSMNLKTLSIRHFDLFNKAFVLPSVMTTLEYVYLFCVTMSSRTLTHLIHSIDALPQPVNVCLYGCSVTPVCEFQQLKEAIKLSSKYKLFKADDNWLEYQTCK